MSLFRKSGKPKQEYEDDGRTIVNMNVEGMPWYVKGDEERAERREKAGQNPMTDEEVRIYKWAALKAALLIVLIFGVIFFLFIAFCDFIWFN